jgi:hypothetical protein
LRFCWRWVGEFEDDEEGEQYKFKSTQQGLWLRIKPTDCKLVQQEMLSFLKKNGRKKGQPNMSLEAMRDELNTNILPQVANEYGLRMQDGKTLICKETTRKYLIDIGCNYRQHSKGIYFERHEDPDVVQHRTEKFLPQIRAALHKSYYFFQLPWTEVRALLQSGALTQADCLRADIFKKETAGDPDSKWIHRTNGTGELRMPAAGLRGTQTIDLVFLALTTEATGDSIALQWTMDDFDCDFLQNYVARYPMVGTRQMSGSLNLAVDWSNPSNKPCLIMDQDECVSPCQMPTSSVYNVYTACRLSNVENTSLNTGSTEVRRQHKQRLKAPG